MRGWRAQSLLLVGAAALLAGSMALGGCRQQAYPVFAVQLTAAPAGASGGQAPAKAGPAAVREHTAAPAERSKPWDLNLVPAAALKALPGISAATVTAMIAGRPYAAKRELLRRHIVSAAQYAAWKSYLVVPRARRVASGAHARRR
ncbi:MAG: hypothetical protein ACRD1M_04745 [Terriglobales bacterium]